MTFVEFAQVISELIPSLLLIGLFVVLYKWRYLGGLQKGIGIYLFLMLGVEIGGRILKFSQGNNLVLVPVYSLFELIFFVFIYNKYLFLKANKLLIGLGIAGALYILGEIFLFFILKKFDVKQFQPYCKVIDNFLVIILAMTFLYKKMNSFSEMRWNNFWLNIVVLVFFTFNTIIFLPFNFLINENSGLKFYFWMVNIILLFLFYGYLISIIWRRKSNHF